MEIINKYISRNYEIKDRFDAGLILFGPEVKSCKLGKINFKGAYCGLLTSGGKDFKSARDLKFSSELSLWLKNFYIAPYPPAKREQQNYNPNRPRKLLLKRKELNYLLGKSKEKRIAIVPLRIYTKSGFVKVEIATAQGLKKYDKREKIKEKEFKRRKQRVLRIKN